MLAKFFLERFLCLCLGKLLERNGNKEWKIRRKIFREEICFPPFVGILRRKEEKGSSFINSKIFILPFYFQIK